MLTHRGWWFFLMALALTTVGLALQAGTVTLIALTLLAWFLGQWLQFAVRMRRLPGVLSLERAILDERGPVATLWARSPLTVRVTLTCNSQLSLPFLSMVDCVPVLAHRREGDFFAEGS